MIIEALVTSQNADGSTHIAAMGPRLNERDDWVRFELRPYQTSHTFRNLERTRQGILHLSDDPLWFAQAVTGTWIELPTLTPATRVDGQIIADACRWMEFDVASLDTSQPRALLTCRTLAVGKGNEFAGFNRAKHAVIEASILASRVQLLARTSVQLQMAELRPLVERTGGEREFQAFRLLEAFVSRQPENLQTSGRGP